MSIEIICLVFFHIFCSNNEIDAKCQNVLKRYETSTARKSLREKIWICFRACVGGICGKCGDGLRAGLYMRADLCAIRAHEFECTKDGLDALLKHRIISDEVRNVRAQNFLRLVGAQRREKYPQ